jgi:hypothetical protein
MKADETQNIPGVAKVDAIEIIFKTGEVPETLSDFWTASLSSWSQTGTSTSLLKPSFSARRTRKKILRTVAVRGRSPEGSGGIHVGSTMTNGLLVNCFH